MNKHTPGPWCIGFSDGSGATFITAGSHDAHDECHVVVRGGMDAWNMSQGVTSEADAHLIAAAPCLLEALLEAVDCGMVPISSAKEGGAVAHSRQVRCADMIRSAIAKARGEL